MNRGQGSTGLGYHPCMAAYIQVHPENPEPRLIQAAVTVLQGGGLIAYPTDSCYALGCAIDAKAALERIGRIRQADRNHHYTLVCSDLSQIGHYGILGTPMYRLMRNHTPGPYTFVVKASGEVPRRARHQRRRTVGVRVPGHPVPYALLEALGAPIMSSSLLLPGDEEALTEGWEIRERLVGQLDLILDGGRCGSQPTTVVDLTQDPPEVLRRGLGDPAALGLA
jgi:tRNA threonylcarbamoyl adenosine modification protein (Sua5/YciO/YrdC/YwlC family)